MRRLILALILTLAATPCHAAIIDIPLTEQVKSFMDERHYDPSEIDSLKLEPNTNGQKTWYVAPDGDNSWDGQHPFHIEGTNQGPHKDLSKIADRYAGRKYGERVLFRSGYYRFGIRGGNFQGDKSLVNSYGPYGDGEVVLDVSMTPNLEAFENVTGDLWRARFGPDWPDAPEGTVHWAVMDWDSKCCREGIGYEGVDNSGIEGKSGRITDTRKNFAFYTKESGSGPVDLIEAFVFNKTTGAIGIVTDVVTTTNENDTLVFNTVVNGSRSTVNSGDEYEVYQLDKDGKFANVGEYFYIYSTKGEPRSRNLIANKKDSDNSYVPNYVSAQNYYFYGLTIVGAPSIGLMTLGDQVDGKYQNVTYEKCRIMFTGKHATTQFPLGENVEYKKNFFYANVMMNWPRGNVYGGNGGWPNNIYGRTPRHTIMEGNLSLYGGGEGVPSGDVVKDNIAVDAYSMTYYIGDQAEFPNGVDVNGNVAILTGYHPEDALERFYLDIHYNGYQRNYVKMHPNGITIGVEKSGGEFNPTTFHIYNNDVIGTWHGINGYFEWPQAGFKGSVIENNRIVLMTAEDDEQLMYTMHGGFEIRAREGKDNGGIWRNNRIVSGASNSDGRHNLVTVRGEDYGVVTVDNNYYYYPNNDNFFFYDLNLRQSDWDEYRQTTGWDANSTLASTDGLRGTDWSDSSKIMRRDLEAIDGWPGTDPEPTPDKDAVVGPWGEWETVEEGGCQDGLRPLSQRRTREVVEPADGNGYTPPLEEFRETTEECTIDTEPCDDCPECPTCPMPDPCPTCPYPTTCDPWGIDSYEVEIEVPTFTIRGRLVPKG